MAETKDKVITAESLSAVHTYNENTYLTKFNPTGSGTFTMSGNGNFSGTVELDSLKIRDKIITSAGSYKPYYESGDTKTIKKMYCAGGVTGSGTNLYFYIPLAKPLIGVSGVTITNPTEAIITVRKAEGGYIAHDVTVAFLGTPSCVPYEDGVTIGIVATSAYNTVNNAPVTVTLENLKLTFS